MKRRVEIASLNLVELSYSEKNSYQNIIFAIHKISTMCPNCGQIWAFCNKESHKYTMSRLMLGQSK